MRLLVAIAGIVGVLMYGAAVSQVGVPAVAAPQQVSVTAPKQGLEALQKSLLATGAALEEATVVGWGEVSGPGRQRTVAEALGSPVTGESRSVSETERNGRHYVVVRWTLSGKAAPRWPAAVKAVSHALEHSARSASLTVQLGGATEASGLTDLADRALGALGATDRQPWSDPRAASVAGRTTALPPGPFGVNVQVAVRTDPARDRTLVWVAWPALLQEY